MWHNRGQISKWLRNSINVFTEWRPLSFRIEEFLREMQMRNFQEKLTKKEQARLLFEIEDEKLPHHQQAESDSNELELNFEKDLEGNLYFGGNENAQRNGQIKVLHCHPRTGNHQVMHQRHLKHITLHGKAQRPCPAGVQPPQHQR